MDKNFKFSLGQRFDVWPAALVYYRNNTFRRHKTYSADNKSQACLLTKVKIDVRCLVKSFFPNFLPCTYPELPNLTQNEVSSHQLSKRKHEATPHTEHVRPHQKPSWKSL